MIHATRLRRSRLAASLAVACIMAVGWPCLGTTVQPLGLKELAKGAGRVVEGRVDAIRVCGDRRYIYTEVDLRVDRTFKGPPAERLTFCLPGGVRPDLGIGMGVPGTPKFLAGERVILFLEETSRGLQVYGFGQGAYHIKMGQGFDGKGIEVVEQDPEGPGTILATEKRSDPEFRLLGKSVPHGRFVELVDACVKGRPLSADIGKLADELPPMGSGATMVEPVGGSGWGLWAGALCVLAAGFVVIVVAKRRGKPAARAILLALLAVAAAFSLRGQQADAYAQVSSQSKWDLNSIGGKVKWEESLTGTSDTLYEFEDMQAAFDEWEAIPDSAVAFNKLGTTATNTRGNDGHNVMAWSMTPEHRAPTLAVAFYTFTLGTPSWMVDADIIFNDVDYDWQAKSQGGTQKVKPVALHEIGHVIGLDHVSPPPTVIMNPIDSGLTALQDDDKAGAAALYPNTASPSDPEVSASASPDTGRPPLTVNFSGSGTDTYETGKPVSYSWNFGDGTANSTLQNPTHTYSAAGLYSAVLTVTTNRTNASYNRSASRTVTIAVGDPLQAVSGKGKLKVSFKAAGKDSLKMQVDLSGVDLPFTIDKADDAETFDCALAIGSGNSQAVFPFTLNGKGKTVSDTNVKVKVNLKTGIATIKVSQADLADALGVSALDTLDEVIIDVPIQLEIGNASVVGVLSALYSSKAGKGGKGAF